MSAFVSAPSPNSSAIAVSPLLDSLVSIPCKAESCPRRARQQLDLILLAIEALDLGGSEAILLVARDLGLGSVLKNRVHLWQLRSTNPLRRHVQRRPMQFQEAKALVLVIGYIARRLTVLIRQLLLAEQQLRDKGEPRSQNFALDDYLTRFRTHFRKRMNPKRAGVVIYKDDEKLNDLAVQLLKQLLFCTGTAGTQRLWVSLFDGEV